MGTRISAIAAISACLVLGAFTTMSREAQAGASPTPCASGRPNGPAKPMCATVVLEQPSIDCEKNKVFITSACVVEEVNFGPQGEPSTSRRLKFRYKYRGNHQFDSIGFNLNSGFVDSKIKSDSMEHLTSVERPSAPITQLRSGFGV